MKNYFSFKINIPEFGIKKGDIVALENGVFSLEMSGKILPPYLKLDESILKEELDLRKFPNGTLVVPNPGKLPSKFPGGLYVITDFSVRLKKYTVTSANDKSKSERLKATDFHVAELYYFIDSRGIVQMTYHGKDRAADHWRSLVDNMFSSKEDAEIYRKNLIGNKVTCLG